MNIPRPPEIFKAISVFHKQKSRRGRETKNDTMIHINRQRKILRYNHRWGMVRKQRLMQILFLQIKCNNSVSPKTMVFVFRQYQLCLYIGASKLVYLYWELIIMSGEIAVICLLQQNVATHTEIKQVKWKYTKEIAIGCLFPILLPHGLRLFLQNNVCLLSIGTNVKAIACILENNT